MISNIIESTIGTIYTVSIHLALSPALARPHTQLYRFCADVSEPKAETTTTWPPETTDRCFVVCSPYRAYFLVAESAEEKT